MERLRPQNRLSESKAKTLDMENLHDPNGVPLLSSRQRDVRKQPTTLSGVLITLVFTRRGAVQSANGSLLYR